MNTNELSDAENTTGLDLSSINVMGMGLAGVDSSATVSSLGSSSQYPNQPLMKQHSQPDYSQQQQQQQQPQRTTPPPGVLPPPSSSSTGSSSALNNTPANNHSSGIINPNQQSKSSSKKRKLDDLGIENISDGEGSSNSASNSSGNLSCPSNLSKILKMSRHLLFLQF